MPERSDISLRALAAGAAIIVAGIALSIGAAALLATHVANVEKPQIEGAALQTAAKKRWWNTAPVRAAAEAAAAAVIARRGDAAKEAR